jgi:hypothetical protein
VRGYRTIHSGRACRATCLGFLLAVLAYSPQVRGQDEGRTGTESLAASDAPPIALTADRVRHWAEGDVRYVLLEDHASVFKGDSGIRAERIAVRISSKPRGETGPTHRVDIYAEGKVRRSDGTGPIKGSFRETWTTAGELRLTAGKGPVSAPLDGPPGGVAILARAWAGLEQPGDELASGKSEPPFPVEPLPVEDQASSPAPRDESVSRTEATEPAPSKPRKPDEQPIRLRDPNYKPVQFIDGQGFPDGPAARPNPPATPDDLADPPPGDAPPPDFGPSLTPPVIQPPVGGPEVKPAPREEGDGPATELIPLPGIDAERKPTRPASPKPPAAPILPGTQRVTSIYARVGPNFSLNVLPKTADGTVITVIRGGVNIVTEAPKLGTVDIEADSVIIWRKAKPEESLTRIDLEGRVTESEDDPMEVYLEGHVIFRQDARELQGKDDQKTYHAERAYYDYRADRFLGIDAQVDLFAPGLIAPLKVNTPRADAFHPLVAGPGGRLVQSASQAIRATETVSTGSRFPNPGYRFTSKSIDMTKVISDNIPPNTPGDAPKNDVRSTWRIDARQNFFFMGPLPVFYWPRFLTDADDLEPPLRQFSFRTNNYFGQQLLLDFNGFKILNIRKPSFIDQWNLDIDYLSARKGVGLGSELGWVGKDPIRDILDPYHRNKDYTPSPLTDYFGYFDLWGIQDHGRDVLGPGPAIVTANVNVPIGNGVYVPAGQAGYQRISVPAFQTFRGRFNLRHMQSLLTPDSDPLEDFRFNLEVGFYSDRQFLEQYYKRLFDVGFDHEVLLYGIKQKENWAATIHTEVNPNVFNTETQWLPKADYYRLGDSLLGNTFTYFQHSGADYANVHTANEVNNKNIFAFIPYDPTSNTSGSISSGRAYTSHELDMPLNFGFLRIVPYLQGQATAWNHQLNGQSVGRIWGAAGARADIMAHKAYPNIESELFNIHGINHKIDFVANARDAYSNVNLNTLAIQDDLDDNTYEFGRRYFALTNFAGGLLPFQYDPRYLLLRRGVSPITGSTDIQGTIEMIQFGIHQRIQTKRGPEGKRRIIDYVVFDLDTTYFPNANRDNFGKPFGQNMYNFEWYIGDRTSIVSYGWFEFWNIVGNPLYQVAAKSQLDPFGMNLTTSGININRPPRGNVFLGYTYFNTGPIQTSALITNYSYWMSPKWYTSFGSSYDFGNFGHPLLLGANASLTRVGADYFVSVGLTANPLQHSYMFAFEIAPRLSPSLRLGSGAGLTRLDPRYAPVQ